MTDASRAELCSRAHVFDTAVSKPGMRKTTLGDGRLPGAMGPATTSKRGRNDGDVVNETCRRVHYRAVACGSRGLFQRPLPRELDRGADTSLEDGIGLGAIWSRAGEL